MVTTKVPESPPSEPGREQPPGPPKPEGLPPPPPERWDGPVPERAKEPPVDKIALGLQELGFGEAAKTTPEVPPPAEDADKKTAQAWERYGQSLISAQVHGKAIPTLPEGLSLDSAPQVIRQFFEATKAEGEREREAAGEEPAEEAAVEIEREAMVEAGVIRMSRDYQLAVHKAMVEAATDEEREEALVDVETGFAQSTIDEGIRYLELAGHDLGLYWRERTPDEAAKLDGLLEGIDGLVLPSDASDLNQAIGFLRSARTLSSRSKVASDPAALAKAVAAEREKWESDLRKYAAEQGIKAGELASAAGAGTIGDAWKELTSHEKIKRGLEAAGLGR